MNYYIGDCHFRHNAVLQFDKRPFATIEEMEETMIKNWNDAVKQDDNVYILGDFCWGKKGDWLQLLRKLSGNKILILGNHDLTHFPKELKAQFSDIKDSKEITDIGVDGVERKVILYHYPILLYKHSSDPNTYMLCGHVHQTAENVYLETWRRELRKNAGEPGANRGQIYNVGAMMPYMNYTPRTLDHILLHAKP